MAEHFALNFLGQYVLFVATIVVLLRITRAVDVTKCPPAPNCACTTGQLTCNHGHVGFPNFTGHPEVINFEFSNCLLDKELTSVPYPYARSLIIQNCAICSIGVHAFRNTPALEALEITGNGGLNRIDKLAFSGLTNLTNLDLTGNALDSFPDGMFDNLPSLLQLYLDGNRLQRIGDGLFGESTALMEFTCNDCSLHSVPLLKLTSLTSLQLSQNNFTSLPVSRFESLRKLTSLSLDNSQISVINVGAFRGLSNLRTLRLGHNRIMSLADGVFEGLIHLSELELHNNLLASLDESLIAWGHMSGITVGFNSWSCDCHTEWMLELRTVKDNKSVICNMPSIHHGRQMFNLTHHEMCYTNSSNYRPLTVVAVLFCAILFASAMLVGCRLYRRHRERRARNVPQFKYNTLNEEQALGRVV